MVVEVTDKLASWPIRSGRHSANTGVQKGDKYWQTVEKNKHYYLLVVGRGNNRVLSSLKYRVINVFQNSSRFPKVSLIYGVGYKHLSQYCLKYILFKKLLIVKIQSKFNYPVCGSWAWGWLCFPPITMTRRTKQSSPTSNKRKCPLDLELVNQT